MEMNESVSQSVNENLPKLWIDKNKSFYKGLIMVFFPDSDAPRKDELVYGTDKDKSTISRSMTLRDWQLIFSFSVGLSSSSGMFEPVLDTCVAEKTQLPIL